MGIERDIEAIRTGIREGRFPNEAAVSQGIVLRLLNALEWPTYETASVWPEYVLEGRRVDFALCCPPSKPIAFIEVKQIGLSGGAERQLFEYAFHKGVPMAILTDGREWDFFLPAEQGDYGERRVYKLDIVERDVAECTNRLRRYLLHSAVASGSAIQAARDDYQNVSRERQMFAAMPQAWSQIIDEEDEMLLEIVSDRIETLCGFKPTPDMVAKFLKERLGSASRGFVATGASERPAAGRASKSATPDMLSKRQSVRPADQDVPPVVAHPVGFEYEGQFHRASSAIDMLRQVFELFIQRDASFAERFVGLQRHGKTRRYLALEATELYPGRPDLAQEYSVRLKSGWWMSTNHSRLTILRIVEMVSEVAQVHFGRELLIHVGGD